LEVLGAETMLLRTLRHRGAMAVATRRGMVSLQPRFVLEPEEAAQRSAEEDADDARHEFDASAVERTVLVRNLSVATRPGELEMAFGSAGEVLFVDVLRRHSGKSLGRAIVEYADKESAQRAMETLSGTMMRGRGLILERMNRPSGAYAAPRTTRRIQLSCLPRKLMQKDLHWIGEHFGDVVEARMLLGKDRRTTNMGTILFRRVREAQHACNILDGRQLDGKVLEAEFLPE